VVVLPTCRVLHLGVQTNALPLPSVRVHGAVGQEQDRAAWPCPKQLSMKMSICLIRLERSLCFLPWQKEEG